MIYGELLLTKKSHKNPVTCIIQIKNNENWLFYIALEDWFFFLVSVKDANELVTQEMRIFF